MDDDEDEITRDKTTQIPNIIKFVPIIQNAPKTPTPPHRASCALVATVGTRLTFVAAQCVRGTKNVFNTSLIVYS